MNEKPGEGGNTADAPWGSYGNMPVWMQSFVFGVPAAALCAGMFFLLAGDVNRSVFFFLNGLARYTGDTFWSSITLLGDGYVSALLLLPFALRRPDVLRAALPGLLLVSVASASIKELLDVARPLAVLDGSLVHVIGPAHRRDSMPSGHTISVFFLAGLLLPICRSRGVATALVVLAGLAGVSRAVCGVHWPADIAVGALVGWLGGFAGWWLGARWRSGLGPWVQHGFALVLAVVGVYVLVAYNSRQPGADWFQWSLAGASLVSAAWTYASFFRRRGG